jgi:hypothetical protein
MYIHMVYICHILPIIVSITYICTYIANRDSRSGGDSDSAHVRQYVYECIYIEASSARHRNQSTRSADVEGPNGDDDE